MNVGGACKVSSPQVSKGTCGVRGAEGRSARLPLTLNTPALLTVFQKWIQEGSVLSSFRSPELCSLCLRCF